MGTIKGLKTAPKRHQNNQLYQQLSTLYKIEQIVVLSLRKINNLVNLHF